MKTWSNNNKSNKGPNGQFTLKLHESQINVSYYKNY